MVYTDIKTQSKYQELKLMSNSIKKSKETSHLKILFVRQISFHYYKLNRHG